MPAELVIQTDGRSERRWIETPVLRVGSDPNCDVRLSALGIAPHAFTLEFRDGRYRVHNRSTSALNIDGRTLAPNSSSLLKAGEILHLNNDVSIGLEYVGDPSPGPAPARIERPAIRPEEDLGDESDEQQEDSARPKLQADLSTNAESNAKAIVQLCLIAFCIGGMIIMLFIKMSPATQQEVEDGFDDITQIVESAQRSSSEWPMNVAKALQRAERARLRRDYDDSLTQLYQVRDALVSPPKTADAEFVRNTNGFVKNRISTLRQR